MDDQSTREKLTIRSAIKPSLKEGTLKKGGWIAAAGAIAILLGGTLLPLTYLKFWGLPIFLSGLILIAIGWLPFRRLQRLEIKPHSLEYDGEYFLFVKDGKPLFRIPKKSISMLKYVEEKDMYGVGIWLKKPIEEKVAVLQKRFMNESVYQTGGCDLFLPYFTENSVKLLLESDHAS